MSNNTSLNFRQPAVDRALEITMLANSIGIDIRATIHNMPRWYYDLPISIPITKMSEPPKYWAVRDIIDDGRIGAICVGWSEPSAAEMLRFDGIEKWGDIVDRATASSDWWAKEAGSFDANPVQLRDLPRTCLDMLKRATEKFRWSIETVDTVLKTAYVVAVAARCTEIRPEHMGEALYYRVRAEPKVEMQAAPTLLDYLRAKYPANAEGGPEFNETAKPDNAPTVLAETLNEIIDNFKGKQAGMLAYVKDRMATDGRAKEAEALLLRYNSYQGMPVICTVNPADMSCELEFGYIGATTNDQPYRVKLNPDTREYTMTPAPELAEN